MVPIGAAIRTLVVAIMLLVTADPVRAARTRASVQVEPVGSFTIEYGRRVFRGPRIARNERWRVRYQPEDRIIEVGTR
jgi:hypothetical protein